MASRSGPRTRAQGIPNHRYLQFDLFDALGLDPGSTYSRRDINKAYQRVVLIIHPDHHAANGTFVPTFPTVQQAQDARDYLLGADYRLRRAHRLLWRNHRSTWNPSAARGTAAILQPRNTVTDVPDTDAIPPSPGSPGGRGIPPPNPTPRASQPGPAPPRPTSRASQPGPAPPRPTPRASGPKTRRPPQPNASRARRWVHLWEHATPDRVFVGYIQNSGRRFAVEGGLDNGGRLTFRRRDVNMRGNQNPPFVGPQRRVVGRNSPNLTWLALFAGISDNPTALRDLIQRMLNMRNSDPIDLTGDD
ncbi:hypothetical protein MMC30_004782 [Trapelia coarctata]|nr:hypothetical protein [Trapelia coarctata]